MPSEGTLPPPPGPAGGPTREGVLVLADISGYTAFMARTELQHSRYLISQLLEAMIAATTEQLEASQVEGDAVFFVGGENCSTLLECLARCYAAFHRKVYDLRSGGLCACNACKLAPTLTVKFIGHYGHYSLQRVGPAQMAHGADVIVPHRLAKNGVPSREYVLVTEDLFARLPDSERRTFVARGDDAGEFGQLATFYLDLAGRRAEVIAS
jgi:hypothetical protein